MKSCVKMHVRERDVLTIFRHEFEVRPSSPPHHPSIPATADLYTTFTTELNGAWGGGSVSRAVMGCFKRIC